MADFYERTLETISGTFKNHNYLIDTHTAVAKAVYDDYVSKTGDNTVTVIASTASPYKFLNSVLEALNLIEEEFNDDFSKLEKLSEVSNTIIPKSLSQLKDKEQIFNRTCEKDELSKIVSGYLNM